jgi:glycosyltransferase involved in cell wall biosynthesis
MPHVSVIIPTYNRGKELLPTVESALTQTYRDLEVIIVDDASTDDTYEIANQVNDSRVRVIRLEKNRGVSHALNTGILASTGEYIALLDHDDIWLPSKIAKQLACFDGDDVGLVYCGIALVDATGKVQTVIPARYSGYIHKQMLFKVLIFTCSSVLIQSKCLDEVGLFDESLLVHHDHDMYIRLSRRFRFVGHPETLVLYPQDDVPSRLLRTGENLINMSWKLLNKYSHYDIPDPLLKRQAVAYRYYLLGNLTSNYTGVQEGRQHYMHSLRLWPFNMKCWMSFAATLFGQRTYSRFSEFKRNLFDKMYNRVESVHE